MMVFPVVLKKGKAQAKCLHAVDLKGWLDAGWKIDEQATKPKRNEGKTEAGE
jgi:hypothetical protein